MIALIRLIRNLIDDPSTDPITSRERFATREFRIRAGISLVFIALAIAVAAVCTLLPAFKFLAMLSADLILLGFFYYYYLKLEKRPIRLSCPSCKEIISANTPWRCGSCNGEIPDAQKSQFVDQCPHCHYEPKAYKCHHDDCGEMIFLSEDRDATGHASRLHPGSMLMTYAERRAVKLRDMEDEKLDRHHQNELTSLAVLEAEMKAQIKKFKKSSSENPELIRLKELLDKHMNGHMALRTLVRQQKEANAKEFERTRDERHRQEMDQAADDFMRLMLPTNDKK